MDDSTTKGDTGSGLITPVRPGSLHSLVPLAVSIGFAIAGQVMLKAVMTHIGRVGYSEAAPLDTVARALREPRLWIGLALYVISAAFWLVVLSRLPLSVAYPTLGISFVAVVVISRVVLHEYVPPLRWVGVLVVALGIALIGVSFRSADGAMKGGDTHSSGPGATGPGKGPGP
jgi:multidrug transporter EmrE-like cation transporter